MFSGLCSRLDDAAPARRRVLSLLAGAAATAGLDLRSAAAAQARGVPILVYHRFDPSTAATTTVTLPVFAGQLDWLQRHGRKVVPLRDALAQPGADKTVITVDDGHVSVYTHLLPLMRRQGLSVTLFIYPSAISNASYAMTWAQLREVQASGLADIQSHTYWHPNFRTEKKRLPDAEYRAFVDNQLRRSKSVLESRLGKPVDMLAWPFGIVDADLEAAARSAGYTAAFAYEGGPMMAGDDRLALPRIPIIDSDRGERFGAKLSERPRKARIP